MMLAISLAPRATSQSAFQFLRSDISARIAGMGGAFLSMQNDPNLLFVNPAGLATLSGPQASAAYLDHLMDINGGSFVYASEWDPVGPVAVGVTYYHYGTFDETDALLNTGGTFSATDLALTVGAALPLSPTMFLGGSVKIVHSSIADYRSSALAADVGFLFTVPEERLAVGVAVLHAGTQLSTFNGVRESLPLDVRVGITKRPEHLPVYLNLNLYRLQDPDVPLRDRLLQFSAGAEFDLSSSLRLRVGYNNQLRKDLRLGTTAGLAGFSGGIGVTVGGYLVDYAFSSYGSIGGLHRFAISSLLSHASGSVPE
ncbi:MAG: type IX secretion system protein PorQ [Bacteroidota bacterium]